MMIASKQIYVSVETIQSTYIVQDKCTKEYLLFAVLTGREFPVMIYASFEEACCRIMKYMLEMKKFRKLKLSTAQLDEKTAEKVMGYSWSEIHRMGVHCMQHPGTWDNIFEQQLTYSKMEGVQDEDISGRTRRR